MAGKYMHYKKLFETFTFAFPLAFIKSNKSMSKSGTVEFSDYHCD